MSKGLPRTTNVVVIGGGVIGCSVAYHLAKLGRDVVLLERKQLTCGTTWHAAGLVGQLRSSLNMTRLAKYTAELYFSLEQETGQATGYRQSGSISIATTSERLEELHRNASMAKVFKLQVDPLTREEISSLYPLANVDDVLGGIYIPTDGYANAIDTTQALAKGARDNGAVVMQDTEVTRILHDGRKVTGVVTNRGKVDARYVVLCAGMWTRDLAGSIGITVPLHACEHYYVVFESVSGIKPGLPVLRDYDGCAYFKEDAGKLLLGAFEPKAKAWGMDGIPADFCFDELPGDFEHFEPILHNAIRRIPALEDAGIQTFFCGPESFTPDVRYHIGEAPGLRNCFVAAGLNSIGLQSAGGIGKALAEWIHEGSPPMDLWEVDVRRALPFQKNRKYLRERVTETLGLLYATHYPYRQYETGRGVRRSPLYDRLVMQGACHGEAFGWERPNWYAPKGVKAEYRYSYGRQNWHEYSAAEHQAVRTNVAIFDQSSFAKFLLVGTDAEWVLNRLCANDVAVEAGRIVYTQLLNARGGIEADLTVTRLDFDRYLIVTSGETEVRDFDWITRGIPEGTDCRLLNITSAMSVISVMGPNSRRLLQALTPCDLSAEQFPFGHSREMELGYGFVRASRITYVGELGWELYIPTEFTLGIYEELVTAGKSLDLVHAGYHALNSLRMEKAYRHWGHDITPEDTPLEAGLAFAVKMNKGCDFIGREAIAAQNQAGLKRKLAQFKLLDPNVLLYHNEPIWRDGEIVGYITSGAFGHTLGAAIGLGYVENDEGVDDDFVLNGTYQIEVAGIRHDAEVSLRPMYDPEGKRIRA